MNRGKTRVLIVDDEPLGRQVIRDLVTEREDVVIVGECRDGASAVEAIRSLRPALVFLDVQMPELDGFAVLRSLPPRMTPATVFVTAHEKFAVRAFETEAIDYLVKPFTDARFRIAVDRALRAIDRGKGRDIGMRARAVAIRAGADASSEYIERLLVSSGARSTVIAAKSIDRISADDYYARLHVGAHTHLLRRSLDELERRLDPAVFLRTHRSAIVNVDRVRELRRDKGGHHVVVLMDGAVVPVSERRRRAVAARLGRLTG